MAYSTTSDFLLGDTKISSTVDQQRYVDDAADEIDITLGSLYEVPFNMLTLGVPAQALLKRISAMLSSGRMLLALTTGSEDKVTYAYGERLIAEALEWLTAILNGSYVLDGAAVIEGTSRDDGPMVVNYDAESGVDAFYERVMAPGTLAFPLPYRDWAPGSDPHGSPV